MRAQFVASEVGTGLRRNLLMSVALVVTVAVSLCGVMVGLGVYQQAKLTRSFWYDAVEVQVVLCSDGDKAVQASCSGGAVTDAQRTQIENDLRALPEVTNVYYESKDKAYQRAQFLFNKDLLASITSDMLPEQFQVKLDNPEHFDIVASAVEGRPGVERVDDQRDRLTQFFTLMGIAVVGAVVVAAALLFVAGLLIFNSMQVSAFQRRRETGIKRLVGASNWSIRLPFVLEALVATLIGGLVAAIVFLGGIYSGLVEWLRENVKITEWISTSTAVWVVIITLLLGLLLTVIASLIALQRHLRL